MNWKQVLERSDILTDDAFADLARGLHIELNAIELQAIVDASAAIERERWEQERTTYRSLLMQARVVLRGPHVEQNIVVRELVERIESHGVQFRA